MKGINLKLKIIFCLVVATISNLNQTFILHLLSKDFGDFVQMFRGTETYEQIRWENVRRK